MKNHYNLLATFSPGFIWAFIEDGQRHVWLSDDGWEPDWSDVPEIMDHLVQELAECTGADKDSISIENIGDYRCLLTPYGYPIEPVIRASELIMTFENDSAFLEAVESGNLPEQTKKLMVYGD